MYGKGSEKPYIPSQDDSNADLDLRKELQTDAFDDLYDEDQQALDELSEDASQEIDF